MTEKKKAQGKQEWTVESLWTRVGEELWKVHGVKP